MQIVVLDTETTGLLPKSIELKSENLHLFPYIVQFSYVIYDTSSNTIIKTVDNIIKLPLNVIISEENSNIHKITNEISQSQGIEIRLAINEFMEDLKNTDLIVAHNLEFDINMLKIEFYREAAVSENIIDKNNYLNFLDSFVDSKKLYCTMKNSINLCNIKMKSIKNGREYLKFPRLNELHIKLFCFSPRNLHNSLNDVLVCLRCYFMLEYNFDIIDVNSEIKDLLNNLIN
jgi:DNA polymerase III epsilon subunit-like protein